MIIKLLENSSYCFFFGLGMGLAFSRLHIENRKNINYPVSDADYMEYFSNKNINKNNDNYPVSDVDYMEYFSNINLRISKDVMEL